MLKKKLFKKSIICLCVLFALFLIYLIPTENDNNVHQHLEYVEEIKTNPIFLVNEYNYLSKTEIVSNSTKIEDKAKELLEVLIKGGVGENKIPNGFASILPSETIILNILYDNNVIKVDFSKDLLDVPVELEEKMIESIVYTLTSIENVDKVIIYVEGNILARLPKSGIVLPGTLTREYGINKTYDFTKTKDINQVTVYYLSEAKNKYYFVPVTKYLNDNREKVKIIIEELASANVYNSNLLSYLNSNTELLTFDIKDNILELSFNSYIFEDGIENNISEEVLYSICLSIKDNYNVNEVIFNVNDYNVKTVLNTIK